MSTPAALYAGFWRRVAAYMVDSLVLLAPGVLVAIVLQDQAGAALVQLVLWWLYKAGLESGARQATLGKRVFGIKVTDLRGERISFLRATARYFGLFVSAFLLGIGLLLAGFTARKQALHDMIAGTLVVRGEASPDEARAGGGTMPLTAGVWIIGVVLFVVPFVGGFLAAIMIPAYSDYTVRSKVTEAIAAAGPLTDPPVASRYVRRVRGSKAEGRLEIELERAALRNAVEEGAFIRYTASSDGSWACSGHGIAPRYLPAACRQ